MRIELFEKMIFGLAVLLVLAVGATVALFSIFPRASGIPKVAVDSELATMDWLDLLRNRKAGRRAPRVTEFIELPPEPRAAAAPAAKGGKKETQKKKKYIEQEGVQIPKSEQVPGVPWLRRVPGVKYARPKAVPQILYRKYQSFEDTWELVQEGGGEFVETKSGTAYQVNWINDRSYLYTRLGLRPGDKVISVNDQPVGQSMNAGRQMYEQLKGQKKFAVKIERNGTPMVLSFFVN